MLDELLLWFVRLWPEFDFAFIEPVLGVAPYMHWAGMYVDLAFIADVLGWILTIEIGVDVTLLVAQVWEKIPGN